MTLRIVKPQPPRRPRTVEEILERQLKELRLQLRHSEAEAEGWRDAWTDLVSELGELLHGVRARPAGRRYATVLDLLNLMRRIESQDAEGP